MLISVTPPRLLVEFMHAGPWGSSDWR